MPLFCTSIFSRRSRILHQASHELRCLCATGPGHVCWWSQATYEASAASQLSFYSTSWQHWRASPLECLSPNIFSSLLPLSAHGAYFLFCHSSIQQTVMEHLDVPAWDKERSPSSMELAFCDGPSNRKDISTLGCPECSREWAGRWDGERRANIKAIFWGDLDEEGTW